MGFGANCIKWMKSCIFNNSMSVIVNGSMTMDFKVERVLRQGNYLSLFLYVMVMEGLTRLMHRAAEFGEF